MPRAKGTRTGRVMKSRKRKAPAKTTNTAVTRKTPAKRQPPQKRIRTTEPTLSFGVEIEAVLAWRDDLVPDLGLADDKSPDQYQVAIHLLNQRQNPYFEVVDDSMVDRGGNDVQGDHDAIEHNHTIWKLVSDKSIKDFSNVKLLEILKQRFPMSANSAEWTQGGVELVTAKYEDVNSFMADLETAFDYLNTDESFYEASDSCGLHIHVGHLDDQSMSLKALQHLLFASLIFEDAIMNMHLPDRSNKHELQSNRLRFTRTDGTTSSHRVWEPVWKLSLSLLDVKDIRKVIYATTTLQELEDPAGPARNRRINWTHIDDVHPLKTVEFRQHAGTVDPREIEDWVIFCTYFVRWAYDHAHIDSVFPRITTWKSRIVLNKLLLELDLPARTRNRYWTGPKTKSRTRTS